MASFNLKTTLFLTPLVSTTSSLLFAHAQDSFLSYLVHPTVGAANSNAIIPPYWRQFFVPGLTKVLSFLALTVGSSVGCVYCHGVTLKDRGSRAWYLAAAVLAVSHLAFVPLVAPKVQRMVDDECEKSDAEANTVPEGSKSNVQTLNEWLRWNLVRTWTTDTAAWICAAVAVTKTLSVD
ncbi:putative integral membrane protein [Emericellopsis atlantica]|uniref:Integral membrane protein n=1 Tax=Emericellopsis atlantica TaxID=2614577 RepID=A0A9P7ZFW6_9HYPO|nr:putative integral membrane protein [Emericellopsis atlantica]KAG9250922.1 putative integral membrane protein [Emericellopsis atlantica]